MTKSGRDLGIDMRWLRWGGGKDEGKGKKKKGAGFRE